MSTISENLKIIKQAKADIKVAIESKGVTVGDGRISTYADKIKLIEVKDNTDEDSIVDRTISGTYSNDRVTFVGSSCFRACASLEGFSSKSVTNIGFQSFYAATNLKEIDVPNLRDLSTGSAFVNTSLVKVSFPKLIKNCGTSTFSGCSKLMIADLGTCYSINSGVFNNCTSLKALVLRRSAAYCSLSNVNALTGTPIASGEGYIYVPNALIDTYKSNTNWSSFANQFRALEDYTVDGTITGEIDETKI